MCRCAGTLVPPESGLDIVGCEKHRAWAKAVANPYHLFDAPMMKTFINSYNSAPDFNQAVMDKILGRSPFKGQSPVDPFCGNEYIRWMNEEE